MQFFSEVELWLTACLLLRCWTRTSILPTVKFTAIRRRSKLSRTTSNWSMWWANLAVANSSSNWWRCVLWIESGAVATTSPWRVKTSRRTGPVRPILARNHLLSRWGTRMTMDRCSCRPCLLCGCWRMRPRALWLAEWTPWTRTAARHARVNYELLAAYQNLVQVDRTSGEVRTQHVFDRKATRAWGLWCAPMMPSGRSSTARSAYCCMWTTSTTILPAFNCPITCSKCAENSGTRRLGRLAADDPDENRNGDVSFFLARVPVPQNPTLWQLQPDGTLLLRKRGLDREKLDRYELVVHAYDRGTPSLTATTTVTNCGAGRERPHTSFHFSQLVSLLFCDAITYLLLHIWSYLQIGGTLLGGTTSRCHPVSQPSAIPHDSSRIFLLLSTTLHPLIMLSIGVKFFTTSSVRSVIQICEFKNACAHWLAVADLCLYSCTRRQKNASICIFHQC